ncbi:Cobalamin adenosyltransferase [Candidatus Anstonella stagnisolia]|nr:Cobalamin adenosyltransferase [Candidatus Anstonella stagnisolia]
MKIYTKKGDKGETALYSGQLVPKDNMRVAAYGEVDELNAFVGLARAYSNDSEIKELLKKVQKSLFDVGADLATPIDAKTPKPVSRITPSHSQELEASIDKVEEELKPLTTFILPMGSKDACYLHLCRSVCRRAERKVVTLSHTEKINEEVVIYLNRLSDFFFMLARLSNKRAHVQEEPW